jgi:DNA-binding LacI/PurR family transcriptional regulator
MAKSGVVSLRAVAEAVGVSRMTVSLALRDDGRIRPELRAKVREAAISLGWVADPLVSEVMRSFVRRRKPTFRETIAVLWWRPWEELEALPTAFHRELRRGLAEGAARHGCGLDEFTIPARNAGAVLRRQLKARGIRAVVITPPANERIPAPGLNWGELAAVTVGTALRVPELNRAQHHHYNAMGRVLDRLAALGCERPVLLTQRGQAHRAYLAAFLAWQGPDRAGDVNSEPYGEGDLAGWVRRRRADVVVAENDELLAMAAVQGGALATRFGGVSLDVDDPAGRVSGIHKDTRRTGVCAIDLLLQARFRHETGIPREPISVMNEGVWVEGETLRADDGD